MERAPTRRLRRNRLGALAAVIGFGLSVLAAAPASAINGCGAGQPCPNAVDDSYTTTLGSPLRVGAPGLLGNDSGAAGTTVDVFDSDSTSWNNADVVINPDGSFVYTPVDTQFTGEDTFDYWIQDPQGGYAVATAYVQVNAIIRDDTYSTKVNQQLSVDAPGVLANDLGYDSTFLNADSQSINGGTVTVNDDGSFQYDPPADYKGADSFTYTVADSTDDNAYTATVHIGVGTTLTPNPKVATPTPTQRGGTGRAAPRPAPSRVPAGARITLPTRLPFTPRSTTTSKPARAAGASTPTTSPTARTGTVTTTRPVVADASAAQHSPTAARGGGSSAGAIVVGVLVAALATAMASAWWWRRRKRAVPNSTS